VVLIVDEAHLLVADQLEKVRLLFGINGLRVLGAVADPMDGEASARRQPLAR
jgi:hypothetical protein